MEIFDKFIYRSLDVLELNLSSLTCSPWYIKQPKQSYEFMSKLSIYLYISVYISKYKLQLF